jgi:hypothetical protein
MGSKQLDGDIVASRGRAEMCISRSPDWSCSCIMKILAEMDDRGASVWSHVAGLRGIGEIQCASRKKEARIDSLGMETFCK